MSHCQKTKPIYHRSLCNVLFVSRLNTIRVLNYRSNKNVIFQNTATYLEVPKFYVQKSKVP